jgi:hypothetical protein
METQMMDNYGQPGNSADHYCKYQSHSRTKRGQDKDLLGTNKPKLMKPRRNESQSRKDEGPH